MRRKPDQRRSMAKTSVTRWEMPEWRNGIRKRLKIVRGQPLESSSLSSGTELRNPTRVVGRVIQPLPSEIVVL